MIPLSSARAESRLIRTESEAEHPVAESVAERKYCVLIAGLIVGLDSVELNPAGREVQLCPIPFEA